MNKKKEIFFKKDEFEKRIFKVRVAMEKTGADLLLTTHPSHVFYLTGHFTQAINDPMCLILPINSQPILDLPYFELPRNFASSSGIEKIDNWEIDEDPVNHIVSIIKNRKLNHKSKKIFLKKLKLIKIQLKHLLKEGSLQKLN